MKFLPTGGAKRQGRSAILVDISSLQSLMWDREGVLTDPHVVPELRRRLATGEPWILGLFEVLSYLICFDDLLLDKRAFYAFYRATELEEFLQEVGLSDHFTGVLFPKKAYGAAAEKTRQLRNAILEHAPKTLLKEQGPHLENLLGYRETKDVDDETLKDMFDGKCFIEEPDFRPAWMAANIADTGMSVERLFAYLEVARHLDVPVALDRSKYKALEEVGKRARAIAAAVRDELERQERGTRVAAQTAQAVVQEAALPGITVSAPLLPSHIVRVAEARNCSVIDAVKMIRDDPPAVHFRQYIWSNRRAFDPVTAGDHLKAKQLKEELTAIGKRISQAKNATGVFHDLRKVTINISNIPYLGQLLKMIGLRKWTPTVAIPRSPPSYEVFIARWFK